MASKRRTSTLPVACLTLAVFLHVETVSGMNFGDMTEKLMMKCQNNGHPMPKMMPLITAFNSSDSAPLDNNTNRSSSILSTLLNHLNAASSVPIDGVMTDMIGNCTYVTEMIRLMKNSSEASSCYMHAFVAPLSWTLLNMQSENNISSDDYSALLWAVKPALLDMLSSNMSLPTKVAGQHLKTMMMMMHDAYGSMTETLRTDLAKWTKHQIAQNYYNCTMTPPSDPRSQPPEHCRPLDMDAVTMMGPFLPHLTPDDVDGCPVEMTCEFFLSGRCNSTFSRAARINPSLGTKLLQKILQCFSGKERLADHLDKLGSLACYYFNATGMSPELSRKFLVQLDNCDPSPQITQMKKEHLSLMISSFNMTHSLNELGSNVALLSAQQLSMIASSALKECLQSLGASVQWKQSQLSVLVHKLLGDKNCNEVSSKDLVALQSIAGGLSCCVLKQVKAQEMLNDTEALKAMSKGMSKGQLKAMLQGLQRDADPSELVQKLAGPLLHSVSLTKLMKANITTLNQVENKNWTRSQAAYLAKKMQDLNQLQQYGRLRSILQGVTCKMIDNGTNSDAQSLAQALTQNPQWLSKVLAGCAAQKLFATLEKERDDYFSTVTRAELDKIPAVLLIHLLPSKVKSLPDSVCPVFLDKMKSVTLESLPLPSLCRPALTQRALLCLGKPISSLTTDDVSRLGPLLCEVSASQLRLMAPAVLNSSLVAMASCQFIPQLQRPELMDLVKLTFGNPSTWQQQTMEALGPLLVLDDNATSALPNKPWMKDTLYLLKSRLSFVSEALKKKIFDLTTTANLNTARRKRASSSSVDGAAPTVKVIDTLEANNVYWTPAQLDLTPNDAFLSCVELLGSVPGYNAEQLAVLSKKATQAFGPVSQMNDSVVTQLGCITRGFSAADLKKLPFPLDGLERISHCGWNESQLEAVWKGVAKYNNLTAQQLGAADIVALNRFICGLNSSEIGSLNKEAFRDAVGSVNDIQCSFKVMQNLKDLAVSAFGDPSTWTEAHVSHLGNIVAGLHASQLAALGPSVLSFVSQTCIPVIPPTNFAELSVAQLEALGPDNAAMVTAEQKAALRKDQRAALNSAETGSPTRAQVSVGSGVPSVSVEGISAYIKPLLFLLMGFLLL
ncbi:otoancorin isoform X2 [Betta splendens]|nr:otoancorin isoform X2 [Betta splendens]